MGFFQKKHSQKIDEHVWHIFLDLIRDNSFIFKFKNKDDFSNMNLHKAYKKFCTERAASTTFTSKDNKQILSLTQAPSITYTQALALSGSDHARDNAEAIAYLNYLEKEAIALADKEQAKAVKIGTCVIGGVLTAAAVGGVLSYTRS